jgi:hypothetical protein
MPRIFDNIDKELLPALRASLQVSNSADFCVGYFNLRGWRQVADLIAAYPGTEPSRCRLLVGMQKLPQDALREGPSVRRRRATGERRRDRHAGYPYMPGAVVVGGAERADCADTVRGRM